MRLLHTSDWHLGITLNEKSRKAEMEAFFKFLLNVIEENAVDTLVISGDIFDTASPSSDAEQMYYNFLVSLQGCCCKDVVIIAGNHDSPSKLRASKELLKLLNIHVYCNLSDVEPLVLPGAIIIPVPFLRDRELLTAVSGESIDESNDRRKLAIEKVYKEQLAKAKALNLNLPIVALGHVAVSSVFTPEKGLYLGGLGVLDANSFSDEFSYVALGHIHKTQQVSANVWYCGAPIAMSFDEAKYEKNLVIVDGNFGKPLEVKLVPIPKWRELITIRGTLEEVQNKLRALATKTCDLDLTGWISIQLEDNWGYGGLKEESKALLDGTNYEVLAVKNVGPIPEIAKVECVPLTSLSVQEVFAQLLEERKTEEKDQLLDLFNYVLNQVKVGQDEN